MMGVVVVPLWVHQDPNHQDPNTASSPDRSFWPLAEGETFIVIEKPAVAGWSKILSPRLGIVWLSSGYDPYWREV
jgi:hypothetical protein